MLLEKCIGECPVCDGSGYVENHGEFWDCDNHECQNGYLWKPVGKEDTVYVNVYEVTREYGGPEEGGWWYNSLKCVSSIPTENQYSEKMKEEMLNKHGYRKHGNIYSVLGGTDLEILIEWEPAASETRLRPHYE